MNNATALLALILSIGFTLTTSAQAIEGTWQIESVSGVEPPKGASLSLNLRDGSEATLTYTLGGEAQSWKYVYAVAGGQLTLEPAKPFGEPQTVTYDIKIEEGKLLLLSPKPEPIEQEEDAEAQEASEGEEAAEGEPGSEAKEGAEAEGEASSEEGSEEASEEEVEEEEEEEEVEEEEVEEEDTRVPVWVLVKA